MLIDYFKVTKTRLNTAYQYLPTSCVQYFMNKCMTLGLDLVCGFSAGAQLFVSPLPVWQAE